MMTIYDDGTFAASIYDYFPYGKQKVVIAVASENMTQTFTGKEMDVYDGDAVNGEDGEGIYYFGDRYYNAEIGIWISTDAAEQHFNSWRQCYPFEYKDQSCRGKS